MMKKWMFLAWMLLPTTAAASIVDMQLSPLPHSLAEGDSASVRITLDVESHVEIGLNTYSSAEEVLQVLFVGTMEQGTHELSFVPQVRDVETILLRATAVDSTGYVSSWAIYTHYTATKRVSWTSLKVRNEGK